MQYHIAAASEYQNEDNVHEQMYAFELRGI
jgi:hypothetical protein